MKRAWFHLLGAGVITLTQVLAQKPATGKVDGVVGDQPGGPPVMLKSTCECVRIPQRVAERLLIKKVKPQYPEAARRGYIEGQVVLQAEINKDGTVDNPRLVSGHPTLAPAAIEAVKQWKYKPYMLNGQPVKVETLLVVNFQLSER